MKIHLHVIIIRVGYRTGMGGVGGRRSHGSRMQCLGRIAGLRIGACSTHISEMRRRRGGIGICRCGYGYRR